MVGIEEGWLSMWVDAEGVAHTVAAPEWRSVVQVKKKVLRRLREKSWAAAWVEDQQEAFYERIEADVFSTGGAKGELPPRPVPLTGEDVENVGSADSWLEQVDEWWRLDVLMALEDALDDE